jgi:hypothetical protein
MNSRPPTTGDRKGTPARSLTALRLLAAEIECARMLSGSLRAFFLVLGNDIRVESPGRLCDGKAGRDVRMAVGFGANDAVIDIDLCVL